MKNSELVLSDSSLAPQALEQLSKPMRREASRELEKAITKGLVANMREQARAYVTSTALQNAGALSELEQHLNKIAPSGAARYQHIIDSYAMGAARAISGL